MTDAALRQHPTNNPHKWGFKFFTFCDSTEFSYAFEIYSGAGDSTVHEDTPDLGASLNVVIKLCKFLELYYFHNFYTSLGLLTYLRSRRIYALGTVRTNRVPNCKLFSDKALHEKNVKRSYSEEYVTNVYAIDISSVIWSQFDEWVVWTLSYPYEYQLCLLSPYRCGLYPAKEKV
ncbi:hypothetical protein ILUMI_00060 [Ignelater luminosus]|uniref:PiggyBac transposable element-derived protein domain-containing protein n=1 Tax=Ignelater luminosus TaxID=2038154 RepID=A0A8K0DL81_IGNLU|nr:hypothetical protein ILUMI_00060 [Ignelater luminosus]